MRTCCIFAMMTNKIKTFIDESKLPINPFLHLISIPCKRYKGDGEGKGVLLEDSKYTKVFVSATHRKHAAKMSDCAFGMLWWIVNELVPAKDYLWINKKRYMEERGLKSMKTVNKALAELDNNRFIDEIKGMKDVYFINAAFIYCGSRINAYPDNLVINE